MITEPSSFARLRRADNEMKLFSSQGDLSVRLDRSLPLPVLYSRFIVGRRIQNRER
jgi:hypothetical protein